MLRRLAKTTLPATTETFGANVMMCSLGERQSIPGAFTLVEQPTKIVKSDGSGRELALQVLFLSVSAADVSLSSSRAE